ncbi:MAG: hypothetical protein II917_09700 [Synergistaceae bacterium]|nr:hypothetical protein [Synergistaceae bacterium]
MNKVQLANPYNPVKNYKVAHWYATPKFDGIRAVFIPDRGFFTRNDKPISGLDHMAGVLQEFCRERGLSFVDGELVLAGGSFQASQSAILAAQHDENQILNFTFSRSAAASRILMKCCRNFQISLTLGFSESSRRPSLTLLRQSIGLAENSQSRAMKALYFVILIFPITKAEVITC